MNRFHIRGAAIALLLGLNSWMLAGCAVTDGGDGYRADVRIGLDYYDPWFDNDRGYGGYGGWGPRYRVGPPRLGMPRPDVDRGRSPRPGGFRPAPGAHPMPSIPSRPHPRGPRPGR